MVGSLWRNARTIVASCGASSNSLKCFMKYLCCHGGDASIYVAMVVMQVRKLRTEVLMTTALPALHRETPNSTLQICLETMRLALNKFGGC